MDYAAAAILAGPVDPAEAARILDDLRGYAASLADGGADAGASVELTFTLRGGSDREAVIRALSLCDDLGPRLVSLSVVPA